ncbi:MAG: transcription-repair coupling factor [Bacillota bacterium]|nr:transcription-repair coupling factor [Bacillota bacterium]
MPVEKAGRTFYCLKEWERLSLDYIIDRIRDNPKFRSAMGDIAGGRTRANMIGISGSRRAFWAAALRSEGYPLLIICSNIMNAREAYEDLRVLCDDVYLYLPLQPVLYNAAAHSMETEENRINVLGALVNKTAKIIVTPVEALLFPVMTPQVYKENTYRLEIGQIVDMHTLVEKLTASGYQREDMTEGPGQFSVRGGILDVFPMGSSPCRIEFFGDEIDSIRILDTSTQRSVENVKGITVAPARELLIKDSEKKQFLRNLENDLFMTQRNLESSGRMKQSNELKEEIDRVVYEFESRKGSRLLSNYWMYGCNTTSLIEYIDENFIIVIDNPVRCTEEAEKFQREFFNHYTDRLEKGKALIGQKDRIIDYGRILQEIKANTIVSFTEILTGNREMAQGSFYSFSVRSMNPFYGKLDPVVQEIKRLKQDGFMVSILVSSKTRSTLLEAELKREEIYPVLCPRTRRDFKGGEVVIDIGTVLEGFILTDSKLAVFSDKDIFGSIKRKTKPAKKVKKEGIDIFTELSPGDYIVHENQGIGIYRGIQELKVEGIKRDYIKIEYSGGDVLYLPTYQSHLIQKYIGGEGKKIRLSRMGGREWAKTKAGVQKAIQNMAKELLQLYAVREGISGYAFSKDTTWQRQFEDLFSYQETNDQTRCIEEIKKDMEMARPMDRLLCGDVGYGKTEVAMRAAFKAVMDGKQVAILVPTTILAQQHYNTLRQRMAQFPVNIEMISRFRTPAQQQEILRLIKEGNVDIIVGTHRLLQKDVAYKDLGLLIIDEEQRFGVAHKEAIKELKKSVDVITLTATPIPRTLHMSMVGLRDMSVIQDPPEDRIPVETYVVEYNDELIRDAVLREINRNGQVYFVHNRVKSIDKMARELSRMIPEASIAVAHGQMDERELENVMTDFLDGKYDILLCTTIIENGLDMPNVNTIIVTDADRLGLSQMYQLRGRVGRSSRLAYAYFTYRKDKVLTEAAEKRLKAIKEFTEFGAGFKIALRDLEIRGAGNILGHEQHGHMMTVGYDMYCKLLDKTVRELKGLPVREELETQLDIKVDAYIPDDYINDEKQKVEMYRRIASIESKSDYNDVEEEIEDRFGDIAAPVRNLLVMAYIKFLCKKLGITMIEQKDRIIKVQFKGKDSVKPQAIARLIGEYGKKIKFEATVNPSFLFKVDTHDAYKMLLIIKGILEKIIYFHES